MRALPLLFAAFVLSACPTQRPEGTEYEGDDPGECSDGADNDRDGYFDCDDQDCDASPDCGGGDDDDATDADDATDDDDITDDDDTVEPPGAFIYAHTDASLYEIDPDTYAPTLLGNFSGNNTFSQGVTDIGVDLFGDMWAVGFFEIYEVNIATAALTERKFDLGFTEMNAMTFLADGTLLAGAGSQLYEVDTTTGQANVTEVLTGYSFAGDMVGLPDGLLYMLMCVGTTPPCATSLVVMDLLTGDVSEVGPTGQGDMYGVAYYNTNELIYGFNGSGQIFLVDPSTGLATLQSSGGPLWWGATTNPARWSG